MGIGVWMIILGFGSLLLPLIGLQFVLMQLLEPVQPWAGIGVGVLGIIVTGWSSVMGSGGTKES